MKLREIICLCALFVLTQQAPPRDKCVCEYPNAEKAFPHNRLSTVEGNASQCNNDVTPQKTAELESLLLGLEKRLPQLLDDVAALEREDKGDLYSVLSLLVVENELVEIKQLLGKLNSTTLANQQLSNRTATQLDNLKEEMKELEKFDTLQVVRRQQDNQKLKTNLDKCMKDYRPTPAPTPPSYGNCVHGKFVNITGPRVFTAAPSAHKYGAWGRDPKPAAGKENWYWLVMLTSSNKYSNYVRLYTSLSSLIVGVSTPGNVQINSANPTTNTIQGPNIVKYGEALYYNCYNVESVCRFNLTTKTVSTLQLPKGTRVNSKGSYCNLDECYDSTDLDLATDESGLWIIYTTNRNFGNLVLSKLNDSEPPTLGQTWHTSVYKKGVTNAFMMCGVLYATRYISPQLEEVFYSLNTRTGEESFNVGILINKMKPNILSLNYSPVDQMLHAYCDANMVSYKVLFSETE